MTKITISEILTIIALLLVINGKLYGQTIDREVKKKFSISFGPEYQMQDFRWSIAGTPQGTNPNILSELIFYPIHSGGLHLNGSFAPLKKLSLLVGYKRLFTITGQASDNDYSGDNRTNPTNLQDFDSNKGGMNYLSAKAIYTVFEKDHFNAGLGVGYNISSELFYLLSKDHIELRSTYKAVWNGPFLSLTPGWRFDDRFSTTASFTFHLPKYYAEANWNQIEAFQHPKSFTHNANGYGLNYSFRVYYKFSNIVKISLNASHERWWTRPGVDILYLANGDILETRFNNAKKKSIGFGLSGALLF